MNLEIKNILNNETYSLELPVESLEELEEIYLRLGGTPFNLKIPTPLPLRMLLRDRVGEQVEVSYLNYLVKGLSEIEKGELVALITKYKESPIEVAFYECRDYELLEGVETYSDLAFVLFKDKTQLWDAIKIHKEVLKGKFTKYGYLFKIKEGERI